MGNHASKVMHSSGNHTSKEKKTIKKNRRRSTISIATGSGAAAAAAAAGPRSKSIDRTLYKQQQLKAATVPRRQSFTDYLFPTTSSNHQQHAYSHSSNTARSRERFLSQPQIDDRELDRYQRQHYVLKNIRKGNTWCEIRDGMTILDIGTANGIWALEMASDHAKCQIIGLDIQLQQRQRQQHSNSHSSSDMMTNGNPKNLKYIQADICESWPFESNSIDLIFQRHMSTCIVKDKWNHIYKEMLRVLKPGGKLELLEDDFCHHNAGPVLRAFDEFCQSQCVQNKIDYEFTASVKSALEAAGFIEENINHTIIDIPIGEWPEEGELKQLGFINKEVKLAFFRNRRQFFITNWKMPSEDYDLAVQELMDEFEEYRGFTRYNCWVVTKQ